MCRTEDGVTRYAPLYIHSFRLGVERRQRSARRTTEKVTENSGQAHSYTEIESIPDRLRWCRQQKGLLQRQVAEYLGIPRTQYMGLENGTADHCPKEIADKLSALFGVPVFDLLDDYNHFLYEEQGRQIRERRAQLGLGKAAFARRHHIPVKSLSAWESGQKRISRASWEQYFR